MIGVVYAAMAVANPFSESNSRELYAYLRTHRQAGEAVYVMGLGSFDQPIYSPELDPKLDDQVHLSAAFEARPQDPQGFWIVFNEQPGQKKKERRLPLIQPGFKADPTRSFQVPGGYAIFFTPGA